MRLPPGPLGSYTRDATPIARDGGRERSDPGTGRFLPYTPARIAGVLQGQEAPRRCNWALRALTGPPARGECAGRGPTWFRAMTEAA
jgi:hypothetical protein